MRGCIQIHRKPGGAADDPGRGFGDKGSDSF